MSDTQPVLGYVLPPRGCSEDVVTMLIQKLGAADVRVARWKPNVLHVSSKVTTFERAFKCKLRMVNNYWEFETQPDLGFLRTSCDKLPQLFLVTPSARCETPSRTVPTRLR